MQNDTPLMEDILPVAIQVAIPIHISQEQEQEQAEETQYLESELERLGRRKTILLNALCGSCCIFLSAIIIVAVSYKA